MVPALPILILLLAEGPLLILGIGIRDSYTLYPYGITRGDRTQETEEFSVIETDVNFLLYGRKYPKIFINDEGFISFGGSFSCPLALPTSYLVPYAAAFYADFKLASGFGNIYFRKVNLTEETDVVAMIERDSVAIGEPMTPALVVIITWVKVSGHWPARIKKNTFQVVLASQGNKTIIVFNYGEIFWVGKRNIGYAGVRFQNGKLVTYPIDWTTEKRNIARHSIIRNPGRIVQRVDEDYPLLPLLENTCSQCTIDGDNSSVITFDGSSGLFMNGTNQKYLVSKPNQAEGSSETDQCKYMLRTVTNENGHIVRVIFSVGVHPKNPSKYKRNFAFKRHADNTVIARGYDLMKRINHFPYYERIEDNGQNLLIVIEKTVDGWMVSSPTCPYVMKYSPQSDQYQLSLYLGLYYKGKTIGICQNFNDDVADDNMDCSSPPQTADVYAIGESCSCPVSNIACNIALKRL